MIAIPTTSSPPASRAWIWKLLILAGVGLLLMAVLLRIGFLIDERQARQREAEASVAEAQAGEQTLIGPLLLRHCSESWVDRNGEAQRRDFQLSVLPQQLAVNGALNQASRYRGLFKVNGYAGRVQLQAQWEAGLAATLQPRAEQPNSRLDCQPPSLMLAASDPRGLRSARLRSEGGQSLPIRPGTTHAVYKQGLHASLPPLTADQALNLVLELDLVGTQRFALVPAAAATTMNLRSDWPHPSFGGRFLPSQREVAETGFSAQWQVSELASSAGAEVLDHRPAASLDTLGFELRDPVNPYVMSDRAIKYGLMFILLTFLCVGLVELLAGRRVHPVQYLLVGLAMSLFFLLLLSLSEHLSFGLSYLLAAAAAVGLLGFYGAAMLGGWGRGAGFGALIALLYATLYGLLSLEQNSLVIGALLLFVILAAVMTLTRRIDWYALGATGGPLSR